MQHPRMRRLDFSQNFLHDSICPGLFSSGLQTQNQTVPDDERELNSNVLRGNIVPALKPCGSLCHFCQSSCCARTCAGIHKRVAAGLTDQAKQVFCYLLFQIDAVDLLLHCQKILSGNYRRKLSGPAPGARLHDHLKFIFKVRITKT